MNGIIHIGGLLLLLSCVLLGSAQAQEKLALKDAIEIALGNNPEVLRAQYEIDAAEGRVLQAGRIPNPQLGFEWNEAPTNFNFLDADERDITLSQLIEFPTKRARRIDAAEQEKEVAALRLDRTKTLVVAEVRAAYYRSVHSREMVANLEEQIRLLDDLRSIIQSRYEAGASGYLDVIRAKVEAARLKNDLADAQRERQVRISDLQILLGREASESLELTDSLSQEIVPINPDSIVAGLLDKSFALRISRLSTQVQESSLGLAKTGYLPDLSVGLSFQHRSEEPPFNANEFTGTTANALGLQLGVSIPLWFWQEPRGQVREAGALLEIARITETRTTRQVRSSVVSALTSVNVAQEQLRAFQVSLLDDVQDILETGIQQYRNSQIDIVNLFDIYRTSRTARTEYLRALLNYSLALSDLDVAAELPLQER